MPTMHVSEIDLLPDSETGTGPLYVNLQDGRVLVIWPRGGHISVKVPMYEGQDRRYMEEIDIDLPTADDLGSLCDQTDEAGNFKVTATHRH